MEIHKTKVMDIADLTPAPYNDELRDMPPEALEALGESLREFGLVEHIVWNARTGYVVGGHQRLKILQASGVKKAPVVIVDLDPSREKALSIALNAPHLQGEFTDAVGAVLDELAANLPELTTALDLEQLRPPPLTPVKLEIGAEPEPDDMADAGESINTAVLYPCPKCGLRIQPDNIADWLRRAGYKVEKISE